MSSEMQGDSPLNVFRSFVVEERSPFDVQKLADSFRHRNTGWSIPEAYMGILISAAAADGSIQVEEQEEIVRLARRSRALSALNQGDLAQINTTVNDRLEARPEALREACETLPADMCLPVFAHCVDIVLSDGELLTSEGAFLEQLIPMLDIDPDHARRIMEVLLLKAQY
ncbi:MAG: tellurite resistance TerB family protein [Myxococcales bacterium]|nr:tellurite resistance TerB family protein [Myxococcales bacterium]